MMLAFDQGVDPEGRNSERMNFRTKPRIKRIIQKAAALSGVDDSTFMMNAAYRSALETIALHERTVLKPIDYEACLSALDNPPEPTERLREAFEHHRQLIGA